MNVYLLSTTAVFEIQMLYTAQVDSCLKVIANTVRKHLFLFKLQTKMFSFSSYVTTEATWNRQISPSDIHNCIPTEHGLCFSVPFQPTWKHLPTHLEGKNRNSLRQNKHFKLRKILSALIPAGMTTPRANATLFHVKPTPCLRSSLGNSNVKLIFYLIC